LLIKGKEQEATSFYKEIVKLYPQGDQYEKAKIALQKNQAGSQPPAGTKKTAPATKGLTLLSDLRYWSSTGYSRVVIESTGPVSFTAGLLDKSQNQSRRLYVDIDKSYLPPDFHPPLPGNNGILQKIDTIPNRENNVRFVLELKALTDYHIFSLNDPFRIIVDLRGTVTDEDKTRIAENPPTGMREKGASVPLPGIATATKDEQILVSLTDQKKRIADIEPAKIPKIAMREKLSLAQQLGLGVKTIVIDPGHGGKDPGAMAFGVKEKHVVLKIAKKAAKILKENYNYTVVLTRSRDIFLPLEERTAIANTHKSDLFVSIHVNAHSDQTRGGIETYYLNLATDANAMRVAARENATSTHSIGEMQDILATLMKNSKIDESSRLARFVQSHLISGLSPAFKLRDLGVKQAPFYVLIGAEMPAILMEISFLTNPEEAKLLQSEQYLDRVAEQLAKGIVAYITHHHTAAVKL
jgi:N-acetylmuramoyl-L-alanine amidase